MKTMGILADCVCLLFVFSSFGAADQGWKERANQNGASDELPEFVPGELLIKFKEGTSDDKVKDVKDSLKAKETESIKGGVKLWKLGDGADVEEAIKDLGKHKYKDDIEYAEPNCYRYASATAAVPSDLYRGALWGMHNFGQTGGTDDADIDALESWQSYTDASSIVVAVIDSGIDYNHEDLADNIWTNPNEDIDGVDDDGNGYIDDIHGWDFVNNDNDPMDDAGHGTHCAGTIGAIGDNGLGVAGVCWDVELMPVKFLNAGGSGTSANQLKAIAYAKSFGVKITSNSYGGARKVTAEQTAIKDSGALFVCSAGNAGSTTKNYPAAYTLDNIISVAATDHSDALASFSNYGSDWVDLGAPGVGILSTVPGDGYEFYDGTSMATPLVTGTAALVLKQNSGYTSLQVKNAILNSVESKSSLSGKTVTGGRLNVRAALGLSVSFTDTTDPGTIASIVEDSAKATVDSVTLTWTAKGDDGDNTGRAYLYDLRYRTDAAVTSDNWAGSTRASPVACPSSPGTTEYIKVSGLLENTKYYFGVKAADEVGHYSGLAAGYATTAQEYTAFTRELVDPNAGDCKFHSFAFDAVGNPSVAYCDITNDIIYFAKKTNDGWSRTQIDTVESFVSLAYDSSGYPCIAYGSGTLKYARYDGTQWSTTTIETMKVNIWGKSLAFDSDGKPGIAYYLEGAKGGLKYAHYGGSAWSTTVASGGARAIYCTLAYKPGQTDRPAIAFSDNSVNNLIDRLKYTEYDGSAWSEVEVAGYPGASFGVHICLAFDGNAKPSISAYDDDGPYFLYKDANGAWTSDHVYTADYAGATWLSYSSAGVPYLTFHTPYSDRKMIRLAHKGANGWESELIQSGATTWQTKVAIYAGSGGDIVGVTYTVNGVLTYATKSL